MTDTFVFAGMTPELAAFLDHNAATRAGTDARYGVSRAAAKAWEDADKPDGSLKIAADEAETAFRSWQSARWAEAAVMRERLPAGILAAHERARREWYCRDETQTGDAVTHASPSGRYRLVVTTHTTGKGTWAYTKGVVYDCDSLVETVCRNYSSFPFAFVEGHMNGHDYLLCGADYQGQTYVELDTCTRADYAADTFCWSSYEASPSRSTLAVTGCYWAAPYEVMLFDFSDPMAGPPTVLLRVDDADSFYGWDASAPDSCTYGVQHEVAKPYGKTIDRLTDDEIDDCDKRETAGESVWEIQPVTTEAWTRPSDVELARAYIAKFEAWEGSRYGIPPSMIANAHRLAARLTDEERATLPAIPKATT